MADSFALGCAAKIRIVTQSLEGAMLRRKCGRKVPVASAISLAVLLLAGCGGDSENTTPAPHPFHADPTSPGADAPPAVVQAKSQNTAVDPAIVVADNTFGLNLLNTLLQNDSPVNTAIAPLSV